MPCDYDLEMLTNSIIILGCCALFPGKVGSFAWLVCESVCAGAADAGLNLTWSAAPDGVVCSFVHPHNEKATVGSG